jgi:hypothetical protein
MFASNLVNISDSASLFFLRFSLLTFLLNIISACGDDTAPTVANNAANAIYAYCVQLRANQQNNLPTGYGAMDVKSATDDNADGIEALATVFLASQAGVYAPICSAVGVTWDKRSIYRLGRVAREID